MASRDRDRFRKYLSGSEKAKRKLKKDEYLENRRNAINKFLKKENTGILNSKNSENKKTEKNYKLNITIDNKYESFVENETVQVAIIEIEERFICFEIVDDTTGQGNRMDSKNTNRKFLNQVLRQLVTLNARCKENAEYLHVLMLNINEIKEKIDGNINKSSTPADFNSTNKAISDIFSTFPISNNEELEIITNAIKEKEDSHNKLSSEPVNKDISQPQPSTSSKGTDSEQKNIFNASQHTGVESDDSSKDEVLKLMNENTRESNPLFSNWLRSDKNSAFNATCIICNVTLATEISSLNRHVNSKKHKPNTFSVSNSSSIVQALKPKITPKLK
ncbi:hypothetical protein QTP88_000761 [Uroleucon formosanum]